MVRWREVRVWLRRRLVCTLQSCLLGRCVQCSSIMHPTSRSVCTVFHLSCTPHQGVCVQCYSYHAPNIKECVYSVTAIMHSTSRSVCIYQYSIFTIYLYCLYAKFVVSTCSLVICVLIFCFLFFITFLLLLLFVGCLYTVSRLVR